MNTVQLLARIVKQDSTVIKQVEPDVPLILKVPIITVLPTLELFSTVLLEHIIMLMHQVLVQIVGPVLQVIIVPLLILLEMPPSQQPKF